MTRSNLKYEDDSNNNRNGDNEQSKGENMRNRTRTKLKHVGDLNNDKKTVTIWTAIAYLHTFLYIIFINSLSVIENCFHKEL